MKLQDGRDVIFRLYFVDTPEAKQSDRDRTRQQAAYFGVGTEAAVALGHDARAFTKQALARPFTIYTRWRRVFGSNRFHAIVITSEGSDLAELLVKSGLARIYGTRTPLPDGRDSRRYLSQLTALEQRAKQNGAGGWKRDENKRANKT